MRTQTPKKPATGPWYAFDVQAWVENGRYLRCGHPEPQTCQCYGRLHEDELAPTTADVRVHLEG